MRKRIKLLQEHACLLRCRGCSKLLIATVRRRPGGLGCAWQEIVDADLRASAREIEEADEKLLCASCKKAAAQPSAWHIPGEPPADFSRITMEETQQLESIIDKLHGGDGQVVDFLSDLAAGYGAAPPPAPQPSGPGPPVPGPLDRRMPAPATPMNGPDAPLRGEGEAVVRTLIDVKRS